jgi:PAS domain S-box-containing protein
MELNINIVTVILFASFLISGGITIYSQAKGYLKGQIFFTLMMGGATIYAFGAMMESAALDIESKVFWSKAEYIGVVFPTLFLLQFVINLVNKKPTGFYRYYKWLYIIPVVTLAFVWTNEYHHLVWKSYEWNRTASNVLIYHHGIAYYIFAVYSLLLIALSLYILATALPTFPAMIKKQIRTLITGCMAPLVFTILYVTGINPVQGLDLTAMSLPVMGAVFLVGIFGFGLFKILPTVSNQITNIIPDGLVVVDENSDIVFFNSAAASILELKEKEFTYQKIKDIQRIYDITSGGKEKEVMIHSDPEKWLEVSTIDIRNEADQFRGSLIVMHDMTKRKRLEQQSRNLLDELRISHDQEKEANSQKDRIIGIIAHDLRTTFHQAINLSEIIIDMLEELTPGQLKEYLTDLHKVSEQGFGILEELLVWARSRKDNTAVYDKIDVHESVKQIIDSMQLSLQNKNLTVKIEGNKNLLIENNTNVLNLVLRNLLINAIKFSNKNSEITVKLGDGPMYDTISIIDKGIGIPKDDLPKLFNSKTKYTRTGTAGESGSGFGLLLCKEMIERNHGIIEVQSIEGSGSTFSIKFFKNPAISVS